MGRQQCRRFTILDGMILIGATAGGLALARAMMDAGPRTRGGRNWLIENVTYTLLVCTVGCLLVRLQDPRPSLRRLMCQPGMAACSAAVLATAIGITTWSIRWALLDSQNDMLRMLLPPVYWPGHSHHVGQAVAAAWLGLLLSRRWRPEPGWIDRFGRSIGVLWLLTMLLGSGQLLAALVNLLRLGNWALETLGRL